MSRNTIRWWLVVGLALGVGVLSGCGGGGGGDGGTTQPVDAVSLAGNVAVAEPVVPRAVADQGLPLNPGRVWVVAIDDAGAVRASDDVAFPLPGVPVPFALDVPTGGDYVLEFRADHVDGAKLAALALPDGETHRTVFFLADGLDDQDLGTVLLDVRAGWGVSDRADLGVHLAAPLIVYDDIDGDLVPDCFDCDDDNDSIADDKDARPGDTDNDGLPNVSDPDDDGDGILNEDDTCPCDTDNDELTNDRDWDDDGDGVFDVDDDLPLDPSDSVDTDGDGIGNNTDPDDDGDAVSDVSDAFPLDPTETVDSDSDGIGDNADTDDDNDGVADVSDAFPYDSSESVDTDGDGIGNNADLDDDNDGIPDVNDDTPLGEDPTPGPTIAEVEPNDGLARPYDTMAVTPPVTVTGTVAWSWITLEGDDLDTFRFTPTQTVTYRVALSWTVAADLDLYVETDTGASWESYEDTSSGEWLSMTFLAGQTYYIVVEAYDTGGASVGYKLDIGQPQTGQ